MLYIDNLLEKVVLSNEPNYGEILPLRDFAVLQSLYKSTQSEIYITKRQAHLILKILNKHILKINEFQDEIQNFTKNPKFKKVYRELVEVKKVYVDADVDQNMQIVVESSSILENIKSFNKFAKSLEYTYQSTSGKKLFAKFTEENIVKIYDFFNKLNFNFEEILVNHYKTIKSWNSNTFFDKFLLTGDNSQYYSTHLEKELGPIANASDLLLQDRSIRYQYFYNFPQNYEKTLVNQIANRKTPKIYIDQKAFSIQEVFDCLLTLDRLPMLVVFGTDNIIEIHKNMEILTEIVKNYKISNVGVYFRLENIDSGKKFNTIIKDNNFNTLLTSDSKIVCIQNSKIPKFFIKNDWQPKSVLALGVKMLGGKISAYSSKCDLIISYTDSEPVMHTWISN